MRSISNGEKVGDKVLTPAVSQFDKRSHVITYDLSTLSGREEMILFYGLEKAGTEGFTRG